MGKAETGALAFDLEEHDAATLEGETQLRLGGAMELVVLALVIADRAARHRGMIGEIELRPVQQAPSSTA